MAEICIKVDIASEFKEEFELALARVVKELVNNLEQSMFESIVSKSKFMEEDADELSDKVKLSMHNDLKTKGLI